MGAEAKSQRACLPQVGRHFDGLSVAKRWVLTPSYCMRAGSKSCKDAMVHAALIYSARAAAVIVCSRKCSVDPGSVGKSPDSRSQWDPAPHPTAPW